MVMKQVTIRDGRGRVFSCGARQGGARVKIRAVESDFKKSNKSRMPKSF